MGGRRVGGGAREKKAEESMRTRRRGLKATIFPHVVHGRAAGLVETGRGQRLCDWGFAMLAPVVHVNSPPRQAPRRVIA